MQTERRYLSYRSWDPQKKLDPRKVKRNRNDLLKEEGKPYGCVVRIRNEFDGDTYWQREDRRRVYQDQNLPSSSKSFKKAMEKPPPKSIVMGRSSSCKKYGKPGSFKDPEKSESTRTSKTRREERARGGWNFTFDPKLVFQNKVVSSGLRKGQARILYMSPKPISISSTSQENGTSMTRHTYVPESETRAMMCCEYKQQLETLVARLQEQQQFIQEMIEEKKRKIKEQESRREHQEVKRQKEEPVEQPAEKRDNLMDYLQELEELHDRVGGVIDYKLYYGWSEKSESECEEIEWRLPSNPVQVEMERDQIRPVEKFQVFMRSLLAPIAMFFSTGQNESPADDSPCLDRENFAPLVLGPSIDESLALLMDHIILAIEWLVKVEKPSVNQQHVALPAPQEITLPESLVSIPQRISEESVQEVEVELPPESSKLEMETELLQQQEEQLRKPHVDGRICTEALTHLISSLRSLNSNEPRPTYMITQRNRRSVPL
ncbi:uncharacterized protein LOC108088612 [Drosophila ficusphila]|uniref:uncharacterized protein LOC108088612 n=1 Tax=Drosophila ficusphila TaxID=30025 RepID=UPI0007E651A3|nr:uncharacterized protein LOC108088612 [Drosophila ficusphila]